MSQKIHLMTSSIFERAGKLSKCNELLWNEISRRGASGMVFSPNDVNVQFSPGICTLTVNGVNLSPEDILFVRLTRGASQRSYEIAKIFESMGGKVSDPAASLAFSGTKLLPYVNRKDTIRFIPSYFFNSTVTTIHQVLACVSFPFIVKPQNGFLGKGVALIESEQQYNEYIQSSTEQNLIAQNFLDIAGEFRVIVVSGTGLGVVQKHRDSSTKFTADLDTDIAVQDPEVLAFAELAAKMGGADVYGADVARSTGGELYLIENNRCPNFITFREASGIKVEEHIVDFLLR